MRDLPPSEVIWAEVETGLSTDPAVELNTAQEVCGRFAHDRGKLALIVRHPDGSSERWTYRELDQAAAKLSSVFARAGLRPGHRVAAILSRQVESWIAALATWRSGLVYVPLFCAFGTDALTYRLRSSRARLVVVGHQWRDQLSGALNNLDEQVEVVTVVGPRGIGLVKGDRSFWAELDRTDPNGPACTHALDAATLLFTSGTTGEPKSCVMPHSSLLSVLPFARHSLGVSAKELLFTTADPAWAYGLYTTGAAPMALGVPRVMYSGDFDPTAWWRVIREEEVTCLAAAPSAYRRLVKVAARSGVPRSLVSAAAAGEPLDTETASQWHRAGAPAIRDGYGLSEIGMVLADLVSTATPEPGTLAGPVPGFDAQLVDRSGQPVPEGESGLIAIRQPRYQMSIDYENRPEAWKARWHGDLFVTEDRAEIDPSGRWRFLGREDDMIIASGHNISPVEVERVLAEHPEIAEAAAVAASGPNGGAVVRAVLVRATNSVPIAELEQELRAEIVRRVGPHATPRLFDYVDTLPRNEVGKLQRVKLRKN